MPLNRAERRQRRKDVAEFVKSGGSLKDVTAKFGVSVPFVYAACVEFGVESPRHRRIPKSNYQILAALLNTKRTYQDIGEEFGLTRQRVEQILRNAQKAGINFPHRNGKQSHKSR